MPRRGQPDTGLATPASCRLDVASPPPGSSTGARQVQSLPSRCCTNAGQAGTPGTKSVPGQSRAKHCAGGAWLHLRASPPWQGPAQLGTGHSQRGGSHTEQSPGFGLRTWPRLALTRFSDVPSFLALPCARHCRSLPVPGLSSLNPFTVKSRQAPVLPQPLRRPHTLAQEGGREGRGGRESGQGGTDQCRPRGRAGQHLQQRPSCCLLNSPIFCALLQREHKTPGAGKDPHGSSRVLGSGGLGGAVPDLCCAAATASTWTFGLELGFARGRRRGGRGMRKQAGRLPGKL